MFSMHRIDRLKGRSLGLQLSLHEASNNLGYRPSNLPLDLPGLKSMGCFSYLNIYPGYTCLGDVKQVT